MTRADAASALDALDEAARHLAVSIAPLRMGVTADASDLEAMFRLRAAEIAERGWASPPPELDRDEDDDHAVHVAVREGARVVGTCRLLLPAAGRLLPIEREFGLRLQPPGRVVQWSRLVLAPHLRGDPRHRLTLACFALLWRETARRGYRACAGVVSRPLLEVYAGLGLACTTLAPPRWVEGELRHPVVSNDTTWPSALAALRRL